MENIFTMDYIISIKSISIDTATTYSSVLFTKDYIYVAERLPLTEDKSVTKEGKTSYEQFTELMKTETDPAVIRQKASLIAMNFDGQEFDLKQLKELSVKNGLLSRGVYLRENLDTFKKYNRAITGGGKELYTKLGEFYKDFKPMSW